MATQEPQNNSLANNINLGQQSVMSEAVIKASGAGKAYQSVAQSAAIAVQDAADNLRNVSIISTTAIGVAMSEILAHGGVDPSYTKAIETANKLVVDANENFAKVGATSKQILSEFPSG